MSVIKAEITDLNTIKNLCSITINAIYPHYYPKGAVEFFLEHHNSENIINDINLGRIFICLDSNQNIVGTVTICENEIFRLFVLPEYQGKGYGSELLDFAENLISETFSEISLSASLPAKMIYLKRGYKEIKSDVISTNHGDFLFYDTMVKQI